MHFKKIPLNFNFDGWHGLTEVLNLYRKRKFHRTDLQYYRKKLNPFLQSYRLAVNERLQSNLGSLDILFFVDPREKDKLKLENRVHVAKAVSSNCLWKLAIVTRTQFFRETLVFAMVIRVVLQKLSRWDGICLCSRVSRKEFSANQPTTLTWKQLQELKFHFHCFPRNRN